MSSNLSEKDILDVLLESDTDEENCPTSDEDVTKKSSSKFIEDLNNLDNETCFEDDSKQFESRTENGLRCVNITSKFLVDLTSIFPPANSAEIRRGYMVRQIGDNLDSRHICLDCGKHYAQAQSLSVHRKIHLGKDLHTCKYCQRKFAVKGLFEDHVRTHTGERPFNCPRCMKSFASKSYFNSHKKKCLEINPN